MAMRRSKKIRHPTGCNAAAWFRPPQGHIPEIAEYWSISLKTTVATRDCATGDDPVTLDATALGTRRVDFVMLLPRLGPRRSYFSVTQKIFISYRRGGVKARTYRMADALKHRFGADSVFLDIESIAAGARFADVIRDSIHSSSIVLIMIGPNWVNMKRDGKRRLDNPNDNLRIEVETALQSGALVIPVLVNGAVMPGANELPSDIAELTELNAAGLSDSHWHYDIEQLITQIDPTPKPEPQPDPAPEPEKKSKLNLPALVSLGLLAWILLVLIGDDYDQETMLGAATVSVVAFCLSAFAYIKARKQGKTSRSMCVSGMILGVLLLLVSASEYESFNGEYIPDAEASWPC
jgi:hypothetical protein